MRTLISLFLLAAPAAAADPVVPLVLSHQGRLRGPDDALVDATVKLKFAIYEHPVAIAQQPETKVSLWDETYTVEVRDGVYSLLLGEVGAGQELPASVFSAATRYLGITLDPEAPGAAEMVPRLQFGALPYAWRSERAASAAAADSAAGLLCAGCVEVGHVNVDSLLTAFAPAGSYVKLQASPATTEQAGAIWVNGTLKATQLVGGGAGITGILPANIAGPIGKQYLDPEVEESAEITGALTTHSNNATAHANITATSISATSISGGQITSTAAQGTAPFTVTSNTVVPNLSADLVRGKHLDNLIISSCAPGKFVSGFTLNGAAIEPTCSPLPAIAPSGSSSVPAGSSCFNIRSNYIVAADGAYWIDPDGPGIGIAAFEAVCDMTTLGGGWTIVAAYTGANGEYPLTNATEATGNPLAFKYYNLNLAKKKAINAVSDESLLKRSSGVWLKVDDTLFDASLDVVNSDVHKTVTITASDNATASAIMGYVNYDISGGGDFGIATAAAGFDHHSTTYRHLNSSCVSQYLYSYSTTTTDGDAGYDVNTALGSWTTTASCDGAEGGSLVFWAGMR